MDANILQTLGYIFESTALITGLIAAFFALHRDPRYTINKFMAAAMASLGLYAGFILLYDVVYYITGNPQIIYFSFPLAITFIIAGAMLLFITMELVTKSVHWLDVWWHWGIHAAIFIGFSIFINVFPFIEVHPGESVDTEMNLIVLGVVIVMVLIYLIQSMIVTYNHGVKKTTGITRTKLKIFAIGLLVDFIAIFINIVSQVTSGSSAGQVLDVVFFGIIAFANILYLISFVLKDKTPKACIDCEPVQNQ